jgi:pyrroline-5-carboxylate reductase
MPGSLLLVGAGKMGSALLGGWLAQGTAPTDVHVVEPDASARAEITRKGIAAHADASGLPADLDPQTIVFAVKPQSMDSVVPAYARFASSALFVSIAAGKTMAYFENHLGPRAAIVRVMPNTPAAVGRGISVLVANPSATAEQRNRAEALLTAVGDTAWIEDESLMDAVTALSGSGPAYVFLLVECMAAAGEAVGLEPALAMRLARATVIGSGELMHQSSDDAATLRKNVTSPGGTTEAALKVLMAKSGMEALMKRAIRAAEKRGRELA